jgi:hypothetical protein
VIENIDKIKHTTVDAITTDTIKEEEEEKDQDTI